MGERIILNELPRDTILFVIEYVKTNGALYDKSNADYKKTGYKFAVWKQCDTTMKADRIYGRLLKILKNLNFLAGFEGSAVWTALLAKYKSVKKGPPSGSGAIERWEFAKSMSFMDKHLDPSDQ